MAWTGSNPTVQIKKYRNRRLYDTRDSRYVTLAEVEHIIRSGADVQIVDAKSGEDLTQSVLIQLILDSQKGGSLLPTPLLLRLVRLGEDGVAEFFGQYVGFALEWYLQARRGVERMAPQNPFLGVPFDAAQQLLRMFQSAERTGPSQAAPDEPIETSSEEDPEEAEDDGAVQQNTGDIAALKRELEQLKNALTNPIKKRMAAKSKK